MHSFVAQLDERGRTGKAIADIEVEIILLEAAVEGRRNHGLTSVGLTVHPKTTARYITAAHAL
jgi:hypothetical protein